MKPDPAAPNRPARRPAGALRRTGAWFLRLLLLAAAAELAALLVLAFLTRAAPFAGFTAERDAVADAGEGTPEIVRAGVNPTLGTVVHPYLGFVADYDAQEFFPAEKVGHPISIFGFVDSNHPLLKRADDRVIVAILGGSVAGALSILGEKAIVQAIETSGRWPGRKVMIVRMALGGWKQPQQLMALAYHLALGGEFDLVINVDGFNDLVFVLDNMDRGVTPVFPRLWDQMAERITDVEEQKLVGKLVLLRERRREAAAAARDSVVSWSPLRRTVWLLSDRALQQEIGELSRKVTARRSGKPSYAATGPGVPPGPRPEMVDLAARVWMRSSELMNDLCVRHGAEYWHVLQPNQYVAGSKPMGPEETRVAIASGGNYRNAVEIGYAKLIALGPELRARGVKFLDMTMVFQDIEEPLYEDDCCHFNAKGNVIMAERMMAQILR